MVPARAPGIENTVKGRWLLRAALAPIATALLIWLWAPRGPEADYAGSGLLLAPLNYGLLVPLIGLGAAAADLDGLIIIEVLALFCAGLSLSAALSEQLLLNHQDALSLIVRFPLTNCAMALCAGVALLAGARVRGIPFAGGALVMGAAFGTTLGLYSPGDDASLWFIAPAGLTGLGLVLVAAAVMSKITGPWWRIARNIAGSWLIATGVLLAGFPLVPKKQAPAGEPASTAAPLPDASARKAKAGSDAIELPAPSAPDQLGFDPTRQP